MMRNSRAVGCALALFVGASGGCSDSAASPGDGGTGDARGVVIDAKPVVIDARPEPPPLLEAEWDVSVADYISDIDQARMFSTGIVIVTDRELILIDKNDGHVIARTQLPGGPADPSFVPFFVRESGNFTATQLVFFEDEKEAHVVRYEWASTDLSLLSSTRMPLEGNGALISELDGELYFVVHEPNPENDNRKELVHIDGNNQIDNRFSVTEEAYSFSGHGLAKTDGHLLFCASLHMAGPALFWLDPQTSTVESHVVSTERSSDCSLVPAPDRLLMYWRTGGMPNHANWNLLSMDGKTVLAMNREVVPPLGPHTYVDGDFVASFEFDVWALDAETGSLRGPYQLPVPKEVWAGQEQLVSDGTTLYAAVAASPGFGGQIHIVKLKPLPRY
ncbi:MAG TPA: hypothetical protein VFG83_06940 [Kofleriaceae bacterium]|nr:hypothetical protein [Kofleriaceae bacterium]